MTTTQGALERECQFDHIKRASTQVPNVVAKLQREYIIVINLLNLAPIINNLMSRSYQCSPAI